MIKHTTYPLVDHRRFASATRDTGYRSTSFALAELIDNAVQAGARKVTIHLLEQRSEAGRQIEVGVLDDGSGMSQAVLQRALQWGGSTRFNDRSGSGRFGMGLPNSSVSQARRVEVFTWQNGSAPVFSYLDLDAIETESLEAVPYPTARPLPDWCTRVPSRSGTLICWSKCDRLDFKKVETLRHKLARELGRIFRCQIWDGLELTINGSTVQAHDPLFLRDTSEPEAVEPVPELHYEIRTPLGATSPLTVRFSLLPVHRWHDWSIADKTSRGIIGQAGVSVLRAGREIANGWYFMNGKRRQNYDDWWRAELAFQPSLDEMMGVTHSKQGIRPTQDLLDIVSPEVSAIARLLSARVRDAFLGLAAHAPSPSAVQASSRDWRLPRLTSRPSPKGLRYSVAVADSLTSDFFTWERCGEHFRFSLNSNHPFFRSIYKPVMDAGSPWLTRQLELLLLAYARAEADAADRPSKSVSLRTRWSDVIATFLGD